MAVAVSLLTLEFAVGAPWFSQLATVIIVLSWSAEQALLVRLSTQMKEEAATIQEDFDCFVLRIPWAAHRGIERPTEDRIRELSAKAAGIAAVTEDLTDWYGLGRDSGGTDTSKGALPENQLPMGREIAGGVDSVVEYLVGIGPSVHRGGGGIHWRFGHGVSVVGGRRSQGSHMARGRVQGTIGRQGAYPQDSSLCLWRRAGRADVHVRCTSSAGRHLRASSVVSNCARLVLQTQKGQARRTGAWLTRKR